MSNFQQRIKAIVEGKSIHDFTPSDIQALREIHEEQFDPPTGGFYNAQAAYENEREIVFKCHYDNFPSDGWEWAISKTTFEFYDL